MFHKGLRCSFIIGSVLLVYSCTPGETPRPLETLFDTLPNGSVLVSNILPQNWVDESGLSSIEELRIGTVDEEGPAQFVMVEGIDVGPDGKIFILDSFDRTVRVFHPNGDFAFSFGQRGEGPGEFERPVGIRLTPAGRLLVVDLRNQRYSIFDLNGALINTFPRPFGRGLYFPWLGELISDDDLVDWAVLSPRDGDGEDPSHVVYFPVRTSLREGVQDTFPPLEFHLDMVRPGVVSPLSSQLTHFLDRTGEIWFGHSREYRVFQRTLAGDTTRQFSLSTAPRRLSERERDSIAADWGRYDDRFKIQSDEVPDTKPMLLRIIGGDASYVLVFPEVEGVAPGSAVDVFNRAGVFLGRIPLPVTLETRRPAPVLRYGSIYGVVTDDLDVQYVVRLKLIGLPN